MNRKRKRLLAAGIIITAVIALFFIADLAIFDTAKNTDAAYLNGEDAFVRHETVEPWDRGMLTRLPSVGAKGKGRGSICNNDRPGVQLRVSV